MRRVIRFTTVVRAEKAPIDCKIKEGVKQILGPSLDR